MIAPRAEVAAAGCAVTHRGGITAQEPRVTQPASGTAASSARRPARVEQVDGAQRHVVAHVVERRPHPLRRAAGQRGPGQPVRGELHVQRGPAGRVGQRAGLPVDDRPAAVRVGVHRVHPPAHGDPVDHRLERHLHLVRARAPPTATRGTPPAAPRAASSDAAPSSAAPGSSSTSSSWAAPNRCSSQAWNAVPRRACGFGGSGSGRRSRAASAGGIGGELDEPAHRQLRGQRDDGALAGGGALGEEHVDVGGPALGVGVLGRPGRRGPPCRRGRPAVGASLVAARLVRGSAARRGVGCTCGLRRRAARTSSAPACTAARPGAERVDRPLGRDRLRGGRVRGPVLRFLRPVLDAPHARRLDVARTSSRNTDGCRGRSPVGPHRCPDASSTRSARVSAT